MKIKKDIKKQIFGRWLEGLSIGIFAGITISLTLGNWLYWYWTLIAGAILYFGAKLQLKKEDLEKA